MSVHSEDDEIVSNEIVSDVDSLSEIEISGEPLRQGKWTKEEEELTSQIIEAFRDGTLKDCPDGCTLRSYLAQKLHCNPMRISKKLAGLRMGKSAFRRVTGSSGADDMNVSSKPLSKLLGNKRSAPKEPSFNDTKSKLSRKEQYPTRATVQLSYSQEGDDFMVELPLHICESSIDLFELEKSHSSTVGIVDPLQEYIQESDSDEETPGQYHDSDFLFFWE